MANWALIKDGKVGNTIRAEADFIPKVSGAWDFTLDVSAMDPQPGLGWDYDGTNFIAPAVPAPPEKSPEQLAREAKVASLRAAAVDATSIPVAGRALQDLLKDLIEATL